MVNIIWPWRCAGDVVWAPPTAFPSPASNPHRFDVQMQPNNVVDTAGNDGRGFVEVLGGGMVRGVVFIEGVVGEKGSSGRAVF